MTNVFPNILSRAKNRLIRPSLVLFDCLRGQSVHLTQFPARLGHAENAAWVALSLPRGQSGCLVEFSPEGFRLTPESPDLVKINGEVLTTTCELPPASLTLLQIGRELIALASGEEAQAQVSHAQADDWRLFRLADGETLGVTRFRDLPEFARVRNLEPAQFGAAPLGLDTGFFLTQVLEALGVSTTNAVAAEINVLDGSRGAFTCPVCWLKFDAGDAMSIAAHDTLRGDPILGQDARLRFYPTRFNDLGHAIDPMGLPCSDLACPHCRRRLPPGFLYIPQHIFSIVGAPSAGKTYYLAILLKVLQQILFREFRLVLKDGDPTGNMLLNQMKNRLFSAARPEEAILAKTALEGAMYERFPRFGKMVALPRPFIYALGKTEAGPAEELASATDDICSFIFYDNAGEHFEPGVDLDDSPGALHVASSSAIFFLFDPTSNHGFRKILSGSSSDPQLAQQTRLDQQDSIMAEMEMRVKRILALDPARKIDIPMAVVIGKCDVWKHLVAWDKFQYPLVLRAGETAAAPGIPATAPYYIDHRMIDANSARLREFMIQVDPAIVAHAEGLARTVRYFPVSAFGHSPTPMATGPAAGLLAPDPSKLNPIHLEIPTLWALSRLAPNLIPSVG